MLIIDENSYYIDYLSAVIELKIKFYLHYSHNSVNLNVHELHTLTGIYYLFILENVSHTKC